MTDFVQSDNKITIGADQLRFDREYVVKCSAISSSKRGETSHRIKTVEKVSSIKFEVGPEHIGMAENTAFTLTVQKMANEDLSCKFFQELDGQDIRLDDENRSSPYSKTDESITTTL